MRIWSKKKSQKLKKKIPRIKWKLKYNTQKPLGHSKYNAKRQIYNSKHLLLKIRNITNKSLDEMKGLGKTRGNQTKLLHELMK